MISKKPSLCVALDHDDPGWIHATAQSLRGIADWLKLGLEAFIANGPDLVREVAATGAQVFLDLKLHDIPVTVRRAAAGCAACGANMLTVHASGGREMLEAAVAGAREGARSAPPKVVAVTLLTSLDGDALNELGISARPSDLVARWAQMAHSWGADGVVASAREAPVIRAALGPDALIVTPGIRPSWSAANDQRRVADPRTAVANGSDILVVGRPITRADDPPAAARSVLAEMKG